MPVQTVTPNFQFILPVVDVTPGPEYAAMEIVIFNQIDAHNHTGPGFGQPIPVAGMNFNALVNLQNNIVANAKSIRFQNLPGALTSSADLGSIYMVNGNLTFTTEQGAVVTINTGGSINANASGSAPTTSNPPNSPYNVSENDLNHILCVDTSKGAWTINLPSAGTGQLTFWITDVGGLAATNFITLVPAGSDTIQGLNANLPLQTNNGRWGISTTQALNGWIFF